MMREFCFFLEAWKFCIENKIPTTTIQRKSWKVWTVAVNSGFELA